MNTVGPHVLELHQAWKDGFTIMSPHQISVKVQLALACAACDIPASWKVPGFLGHSASLGCNKCLIRFESHFGQSTNHSWLGREHWVLHAGETHCHCVTRI